MLNNISPGQRWQKTKCIFRISEEYYVMWSGYMISVKFICAPMLIDLPTNSHEFTLIPPIYGHLYLDFGKKPRLIGSGLTPSVILMIPSKYAKINKVQIF